MQDIAEAVGIKAASLYNHIKSKQEILANLSLHIADIFTEKMATIYLSKIDNFKKLEKLISLHINLTIENPQSMSLITGEWVHLEEPHLTNYSKQRLDYELKFKQIIDKCKIDGSIRNDVDTDLLMFSILSTLHWLYSWHHKNINVNAVELEEQLIKSLLHGLKTE